VNTTREQADTIAAHLTDKRVTEEGYVPTYALVHAEEVKAFDPQPVKVGDVVSGAVANTLPKGSSIVCVGTNHITLTKRMPSALLRGADGYIHPDLDPGEGPVDNDARFEILHIGGG
jgi:hypothetical protein